MVVVLCHTNMDKMAKKEKPTSFLWLFLSHDEEALVVFENGQNDEINI